STIWSAPVGCACSSWRPPRRPNRCGTSSYRNWRTLLGMSPSTQVDSHRAVSWALHLAAATRGSGMVGSRQVGDGEDDLPVRHGLVAYRVAEQHMRAVEVFGGAVGDQPVPDGDDAFPAAHGVDGGAERIHTRLDHVAVVVRGVATAGGREPQDEVEPHPGQPGWEFRRLGVQVDSLAPRFADGGGAAPVRVAVDRQHPGGRLEGDDPRAAGGVDGW